MSLLIVVIALAQRRSSPAPPVLPAVRPLAATSSSGWAISLVRLESCPARGIVVAVLELRRPEGTPSEDPLSEPIIDGLTSDGGFWIAPAAHPGSESFAGAGGAPESFQPSPRAGAAVLRFRGTLSGRTVTLCGRISGAPICLPPAAPTVVPAAVRGAVGSIFGR